MQLKPRVNWSLCGSKTGDLEPALLQLLKAIQQQGSLQKAARALNLSYRYAWGLVKKWEKENAAYSMGSFCGFMGETYFYHFNICLYKAGRI